MTTANALPAPEPKKTEPKRGEPAPTRRDDDAQSAGTRPETDDRWTDMPCTD